MQEKGKFPEIDMLVDEASEIELAIFDYAIRMCASLNYARPVDIRVAMIEDGKSYPQEKDTNLSIKVGCLAQLGKLFGVGILSSNPDKFSTEADESSGDSDAFFYTE